MPKNLKHFLDKIEAEKVSVILNYKKPSSYNISIKGDLVYYDDDLIAIKPAKLDNVKADIYNWEYIISIRVYEKGKLDSEDLWQTIKPN
jgi:hypothetical protein